jgi:hypothetical protein
MRITLNEPIVVPQVDEKVFPHLLVSNLNVNVVSLEKASYQAIVIPANFDTGEYDHSSQTLIEGDLIAEISENPAIATAWSSAVEAIGNKLSSIATVSE